MAGTADRAAAEPMVLTDAQLDRVTAGRVPTESISLNYEEIKITYTETQSDHANGGELSISCSIRTGRSERQVPWLYV
jgi:type VI protein secretion system component Hcp